MTMRGLLAPLALAGLAACGAPEQDGAALPGTLGEPAFFPLLECPELEVRPCDVRAPECLPRLHAIAACLRTQDAGEPFPVTVMTEAELAEYLEAGQAGAEPHADLHHLERALRWLGLVERDALAPEEQLEESVDWIGGLYRDEEQDIVLIERDEALDEATGSIILVHELVHLLQDRDFDLGSFWETHWRSYDSGLALRSLYEGEADFHSTRYAASALGLNPASIEWDGVFQDQVAYLEDSVQDDASPLTQSTREFPYVFGARYARLLWETGGLAGVLDRFAEPPLSTLTLLASEDELVSPEAPLAVPEATPDPAYRRVDDGLGTLGAWSTFIVLSKAVGPGQARSLALDWRGDSFAVYAGNDGGAAAGDTALVWRIEFAAPETALAVQRNLAGSFGDGVRSAGTRVVVALDAHERALEWAFSD